MNEKLLLFFVLFVAWDILALVLIIAWPKKNNCVCQNKPLPKPRPTGKEP